MRKFLISRFVQLNIFYQFFLDEKNQKCFWDCDVDVNVKKQVNKTFGIYMRALSKGFINMLVSIKEDTILFFSPIWIFIKWITISFRKATYEYTAIAFLICGFISIKFPTWQWTDYTWLGFFFVLMLTILVTTIKEKINEKG